jgi:hypothetical protein
VNRRLRVAEREGFEPSRGLSPLLAFQASAFNHSTTSPYPQPTSSVGVPVVLKRRSARNACCSPPSIKAAGSRTTSSFGIVGAVLAVVLVGVTPLTTERHAVIGHFNVPRQPVPTPVASPSSNAIANSGFETGSIDGGWYQCGDVSAYTTTEHPYGGTYDEYSGTRSGAGEPRGNSGVCQRVTVPAAGLLTARLYQLSDESDATFAYQEADLLDARGNVVVNLYRAVNNRAAWVLGKWNLAAYAGRTFWLYFGVHGDGYSKLATEQFVDDVVLTSASSSTSK